MSALAALTALAALAVLATLAALADTSVTDITAAATAAVTATLFLQQISAVFYNNPRLTTLAAFATSALRCLAAGLIL